MKRTLFVSFLVALPCFLVAQNTFKAGWNTYNVATITHEYTYSLTMTDSIRLSPIDSSQILATADSLVTLIIHFPARDKSVYKTVNYLNPKKVVVKTEDFKDDNPTMSKEWRYDDKNFVTSYYEDNKINGNNFRKSYDNSVDKKTGERVVTESSFANGKIEFYTKIYYDKKGVKYKEVRYNNNNKDIVHVESFFYGENGKLKERSVFFPEWHVTKKFEEKDGSMLPKCTKTSPVGIPDKVTIPTRVPYVRKVISKNQGLLLDAECQLFEYNFKNFSNCEIFVCNGQNAAIKKLIFRFKEKIQ